MKRFILVMFKLVVLMALLGPDISPAAEAHSSLPILRFPLGVALQTFDPVEAEDFVTIRVLMNLGCGLTVLDKNLKAQPGLAEKWNVSKDHKVLTFKLKDVRWSDGKPIVASDFIRGFQRTFSPASAAKIGVPFLDLIEGTKDYKSGKLTDFSKTGISAPDDHTLVFHLTHAAAYFPALLALPVAFPQPPGTTDYKIKPGAVTSGSYVMKELKPDKVVLVPNEQSAMKAQNILEFRVVPESATAVALYERGDLDVLDKVPSSDFDRFKSSPELVSAPWLSTYYIGFNVTRAPFDDKSLRQAFIESVNRDDLKKILKDPQKPSSSWIPTPLPTSDETFGPRYDPAAALAAVHSKLKDLHIELVFDTQEKNTLITSFIQAQLKTNLGLDIGLRGMEWKSYLAYLKSSHPPLFRFGWLAAFPDPLSHLGVFTSGNPNNYTGYANAEYDKLIEQIARLPEGPKRVELIRRAQKKLLTDDVVIFPLYHYVQYVLIRRSWQGLELSPMGLLYFHRAHRVDQKPSP